MLNQSLLEESLAVLGESLADRGVTFEIVAVGGGSLLLLGLISRPTADLDVVAFIEAGRYVKPTILPAKLADAARATARVMGIREDWINAGPGALLDFGLPLDLQTGRLSDVTAVWLCTLRAVETRCS
jgi:hypothetical protein